ncbi:hypothetical protein EXIGLDRAFT_726711 [Exidia glandulosa HHB12029]|uniref:PA14 domain-containing protein n=1 Tax=Exidia glandulosa HHB12029 TaxID=1314781 RepID=A0A165DLM6_EXIGL|nr:hypothetical protein EXIGLDRAFT_726711 [Exidia glandulosa HHB12029]
MSRSSFLLGLLFSALSSHVFAQDPDPLATGIILRQNSPAFKYSKRTDSSPTDCLGFPTFCSNAWFTRDNPRKDQPHEQFPDESATFGPNASFTFTFTGSSAIALFGQRDKDVIALAKLNGQPYNFTADQFPTLFRADKLDKGTTYTFEVSYGSPAPMGFLAVTAIALEQGATTPDAPAPAPGTPAPSGGDPAPSGGDPTPGSTGTPAPPPSTDAPAPAPYSDPQAPAPSTPAPAQNPPAPTTTHAPPSGGSTGKPLPPAGPGGDSQVPGAGASTTDSSTSPDPSGNSDTTDGGDSGSAPKAVAGSMAIACAVAALAVIVVST